jgi:hypothetical protein
MPRPITWQRRLAEMHRQVADSARTPYTRGDLEKLFRVGSEAAKKLLQLMPRFVQANATVVERQDLLAWLSAAIDAEDLRPHLDELRRHPPTPSRRKLRLFVAGDVERGRMVALSHHNIWLNRGTLELEFTTLDDFCSKMLLVTSVIEDPDFERRFCDRPTPTLIEQTRLQELTRIRADNRFLEKVAATRNAVQQGLPEIAELLRAEADAALVESKRLAAVDGERIDELLQRCERMLITLFPTQTA